MIIIAHRGNTDGPNRDRENTSGYILSAIRRGFDVEVDIWFEGSEFFLGHDKPITVVKIGWLESLSDKLWIHCKNVDAAVELSKSRSSLNFFIHDQDSATLTSRGIIWTKPGSELLYKCIDVMPETQILSLEEYGDIRGTAHYGVCTDYAELIKNSFASH